MNLEKFEKTLTPWEEISSVVSIFKQPIGEDLNGQHQKNIITLQRMIGDQNEFFMEDPSTFNLPETESEEGKKNPPEVTNLFAASCEHFLQTMYSTSDHLSARNYSAIESSIGHFENEIGALEPLAQNIDKPQDFTELREILFDLGPSKIKQSLERLDEEPPLPNLDN